jgi:tyrosine-protein phosphatase SIW14
MTGFRFAILILFFLSFPQPFFAQQLQTVSVSKNHPEFAEKIHIDGVKDAGKLGPHLYRGTQPSKKGLRNLKKLGVTTVVDLRGEFRHESTKERRESEALGMHFVLIPGNGWHPPTDKQMAEFFSIIAQRPENTVFIHCWLGSDRTGVFIAAYRIAFDHWSAEHALEEMHAFHFKAFWHPAMKKYVREFPKRLETSPALAPYRTAEEPHSASGVREPRSRFSQTQPIASRPAAALLPPTPYPTIRQLVVAP